MTMSFILRCSHQILLNAWFKWFRFVHSKKNHTAPLINTLKRSLRDQTEILDLVNRVWTINLFNLFTSGELVKTIIATCTLELYGYGLYLQVVFLSTKIQSLDLPSLFFCLSSLRQFHEALISPSLEIFLFPIRKGILNKNKVKESKKT